MQIAETAVAALHGEGLLTRSLVQDFLQAGPGLSDIPKPKVEDVNILAVAAPLLELLAGRSGNEAPVRTTGIGPVPEPIFLLMPIPPRPSPPCVFAAGWTSILLSRQNLC